MEPAETAQNAHAARVSSGTAKALLRLAKCFESVLARCLLLIILGFAVRTPALPGELIWDDAFLASENPLIKSPLFIFEVFRHHLILDSLSSHYRPVQNLSYILDYVLWDRNTYGFHLSNVAWHVASGVLLYLLLADLLGSFSKKKSDTNIRDDRHPDGPLLSWAAFFIALLWVVHPVHSAAVDYISGRADSLAFVFCCGAWLLLRRACRSASRLSRVFFSVLAASSLLLGLCSRESACMWLLIFLIHLFFFERKMALRARCLILVLALGVVGIYAGLRQLPPQRSTEDSGTSLSAPVRAVLMLRSLGDYGRLMVFPGNLHMERSVVNPRAIRSNAGWRQSVADDYLSILGLAVAAGLLWGAIRRGAGQPLRVFGACWFLLTYLPISNLFELNATVAEHWLYLPSVGFLLFLAGCALELRTDLRRYATTLACLVVIAFSGRSYVRSSDWVSEEVFYRRTLEAGGVSPRIILNLARIHAARGEYAVSEKLLRRALAINPVYLLARNNLADTLQRQGKKEEAERLLHEGSAAPIEDRKSMPGTWALALNLAKSHVRQEDYPAALKVLAQARRDYPAIWDLISFESESLRKAQGAESALPAVQKFARDHWWHLPSQVALGKLLFEKGEYAAAEAAFRHASRLDVHDVAALNMLALLNVSQQRFDQAYRTQRRAIARQPDEPRQYLILSDILEKMGRPEEARAMIAHVSRMELLAQATPVN